MAYDVSVMARKLERASGAAPTLWECLCARTQSPWDAPSITSQATTRRRQHPSYDGHPNGTCLYVDHDCLPSMIYILDLLHRSLISFLIVQIQANL